MLRKSIADLNDKGQVGDWCFVQKKDRMTMLLRCPVAPEFWAAEYRDEGDRGEIVSLPLSGEEHPVWSWNGNADAPTLIPSIGVVNWDGRFRWHGWLRGGELETA